MGELEELRGRCDRALNLHGLRPAAAFLDDLVTDDGIDMYGEGGPVTAIEAEVTRLLDKPAAVFMPSGTMAQQIALRVHCDRRKLRTFGCHPTGHLEQHEDRAYQHVHNLMLVPVGDHHGLITIDDLREVKEQLGAFLFELPQREIGCRLPEWADLLEQVEYVRERGAAVHADGARLWECTPYYGKELHEIAALFDTVYVSFYKGLGGLSGCCLAGEADVIDQARLWRHRHGGTLWSLWPLAASALGALKKRLPLMPRYYEHAQAIAQEVAKLPGVEVVPNPPQTPIMQFHLRTTSDRFEAGARAIAEEDGIWTWSSSYPTDTPTIRAVELGVGDATLQFTPSEVARIVERLTGADEHG